MREDENQWIWQLRRFEKIQVYLTPQQVAYARILENARGALWDCEIHQMRGEQERLAREEPLRKPEYVLVEPEK
jgi:hypothetical protein